MARKIEELFYELRARTEGLSKDLEESQRQLGKWSTFVANNPTAVAGALGAAILGIGIKAIEASDKTERAIRSITTNMPRGAASADELRRALGDIAIEAGVAKDVILSLGKEVARLGAGSTQEFRAKVSTAEELAQLTGIDPTAAAQGIDQLTDLFDVGADKIKASLAQIREASRGKVDFESIFGAFQATAPRVRELGLSLDEATRAIVRLLDQGRSAKQVAAVFNEHDAAQIRNFANGITLSADALSQWNGDLKAVRSTAEATSQQIKNKLGEAFEDLGHRLAPARDRLYEIATQLTKIAAHGRLSDLLGPGGVTDFVANATREARNETPKIAGPVTFTTIGQPLPARSTGNDLGLTLEQQKKIEEANQKVAALRLQLQELLKTTEEGRPKSDAFAESIAKWKVAAEQAHLPGLKADLAQLDVVLQSMRRAEGAKEFADALEQINAAFTSMDDALAQFQGPLEQFDRQVEETLDKIEAQNQALSGGDAEEAAAKVAILRDKFAGLRAAIADTITTEKGIDETRSMLDGQTASIQQITDAIGVWANKAGDLREKIAKATDPKVQAQYKQELQDVVGILGLLQSKWDDLNVTIGEGTNRIAQMAEAFTEVGRSVVAAAQALGVLDDKTASILQNGLNAAEGVGKIAKGDVVGGTIETITSVAALGKALFGLGKNSAEARLRAKELQDSIANLFAGLLSQLSATGGNSLPEQIAAARREYENARNQIERDEGGKKNQTQREKDLDRLNELEKQRIEQLQAEYAIQQKQLQEDFHIRDLRAKGLDEEADALEFAEKQQREYAKAIADGDDAATLAALAEAELSEARRHAAEAAIETALKSTQQSEQIHHVTDPVQQFADKAADYAALGGSLGKLFDGIDLAHITPDQIAALDTQFQALFDQLKNSPDSVDLAGLSIDDLIAALLDLDSSATNVANTVADAARQMAEAEAELRTGFDILGTGAAGQAQAFAQLYGFDLGDISTQEGVNAAIAALQALYQSNTGDQEKAREIENTINALRGIQFPGAGSSGGASAATSGGGGTREATVNAAQSLTEQTGNRMADYLASILLVDRETLRAQQAMLATLTRPIITGPILPPLLPSGFGAPTQTAGTAGGLEVRVSIGRIVVAAPNGSDPTAFASEISNELIETIGPKLEQWLYQRVANQQLRNGSTLTTA